MSPVLTIIAVSKVLNLKEIMKIKDTLREEGRVKVQQCIYIFSRCDVDTPDCLWIQLTSKMSENLGKVIYINFLTR